MPKSQNVPNVYGAEYKQAILSKCGCTIPSATVKQFSHFKAQEFKMIRNGKGTCVYSTTKGNKLFNKSGIPVKKEKSITCYSGSSSVLPRKFFEALKVNRDSDTILLG